MTPTTQIRLATRLFAHLEDLVGLKQLEPQEAVLLSDALSCWIRVQQTRITPQPTWSEAALSPTHAGPRTYRLEERFAARTRLWVEEEGQQPRQLKHVPIFCSWGFGTSNLAARDTALAILADYFDEPFTKNRFVQGQCRACQSYPALATYLHARGRQALVHTGEILTLLHAPQTWRNAWEQGETAHYPSPANTSPYAR